LVSLALGIFALSVASVAASPLSRSHSPGPKSSLGSQLPSGATLNDGSWLSSPNGQYRLNMQSDGNLVLRWGDHVLWASKTSGNGGDHAVMQSDGNLVIYQANRAIWASASARPGHNAYRLSLQNDGNLVVDTATGSPIWATNTEIGADLQLGDSGPAVLALQTHLVSLGYWLGTPDGTFGDSTQQAVYALQKAAGLDRSGVVDRLTAAALTNVVVPKPRAASGNLVEVNLEDDLLMVIQGGKLAYTLNTSTGGGYTYVSQGVTSVAITPRGVFHIFAVIDGLDVAPLGELWRPRFFEGGFAVHGDSYVPPFPVSHGCVRVSDEAINWIWAANILPIGSRVWVF
jgi:lipoprotein-anchoring transpeptidase ErfK/SrfK